MDNSPNVCPFSGDQVNWIQQAFAKGLNAFAEAVATDFEPVKARLATVEVKAESLDKSIVERTTFRGMAIADVFLQHSGAFTALYSSHGDVNDKIQSVEMLLNSIASQVEGKYRGRGDRKGYL
jgi:hypothetical protein